MKEYDIVIVGAGVAGMTAAIYALRAKKSVVIFEKLSAGGQMLKTSRIENYPGIEAVSGEELAASLREQVKKFGGKMTTAEVKAVKKEGEKFRVETDEGEVVALAVIIANGSKERRLGLPREEELTGRGVSYCATCDGALFKNRDVAVYGGGNTAAYSVMYLSKMCAKVYWIFRKPAPRAEKHLVERVREIPNVETLSGTVIAGLKGEETLKGLELDDGRELDAEALFVTIGREADNARFADLIELDEAGYIKAGEDCKTSQPGVFSAGDTRVKGVHQIVTAAADGAVAASGAIEYINSR